MSHILPYQSGCSSLHTTVTIQVVWFYELQRLNKTCLTKCGVYVGIKGPRRAHFGVNIYKTCTPHNLLWTHEYSTSIPHHCNKQIKITAVRSGLLIARPISFNEFTTHNKDHRQCSLSLVVNSGAIDLASRFGTNGLVKQEDFIKIATSMVAKFLKNWNMIGFVIWARSWRWADLFIWFCY